MKGFMIYVFAGVAAVGAAFWFYIQNKLIAEKGLPPVLFIIVSPLIAVIFLAVLSIINILLDKLFHVSLPFLSIPDRFVLRNWISNESGNWCESNWFLLLMSGVFLVAFYLFFAIAVGEKETVLPKFIPFYTLAILFFTFLINQAFNKKWENIRFWENPRFWEIFFICVVLIIMRRKDLFN